MAIQFPGALDTLQNVTTSPGEVPLAKADKDGGSAPRSHDVHHRDLGSAVVAIQALVVGHDHDHSGDTTATNKPGMHKGAKLKQQNTHQSPDTDQSQTSLHHTLGDGLNQAAPGKATKDSITGLTTRVTNIETSSAYVPLKTFSTLSAFNSWLSSASTVELSSPVMAFIASENQFRYVASKTNEREVDTGIPAGVVSQYAGLTAPKGYLLCNGQSVSRAQYSKLFSAIGTTYGSQSSTTFNVPDMRGRTAFGVSTDSEFNELGKKAGDRRHSHTEGDMAAAIGAVQNNTLTIAYQAGALNSRGPRTSYSYSLWFAGNNVARKSAYSFNHHTRVYGTTASASSIPPSMAMNYIIKA